MAQRHSRPKNQGSKGKALSPWFGHFAHETARLSGRPGAFILASLIIVAWALSGPLFGYSDTWQLAINTGTTIVTFLMVFLIQNTQNRDALAVQLKLAEIIIVMENAENRYATIEDLSDEELERIHNEFRARAEQVLESLKRRRSNRKRT
jgi:low affinity Fe/Cu permease